MEPTKTEGRIEPGYYKGKAVAGSVQYGYTKQGTEQIAIDIEIPALRRTFTTFLYFTDDAAPYAIERLRACGWTGSDVTRLDGIDRNVVDVQVKYETYNNKEQLKVDIATSMGRFTLDNVMNPKQLSGFGARVKSLLDAPPGERATNSNRSEDRVPF